MSCRQHGSTELLLEMPPDAATPVIRFLPEQDPHLALAGNPLPEDVVVDRSTNLEHFYEKMNVDDPRLMVGRNFTDDGYMSTSLGGAVSESAVPSAGERGRAYAPSPGLAPRHPEALLDAFRQGTLLVSVDEDGKHRFRQRDDGERILDVYTSTQYVPDDGRQVRGMNGAELAKGLFRCYVAINPGSRANISIPSADLAVSAFG